VGSNPTGPTRFLSFFDNSTESRPDGKALVCLNKGSRKRLAGSTPALSAIAEGTAEWSATGPENQSVVMSDGRSIRLPSANFAQVREPGRNGPAVTRFPRVGRGGSNPPLCTMCQCARIGIAACLRNRCLRVRISPLAPTSFCGYDAVVWENYSLGSTGSLSKARTPKTHS
jgi:hypothetical protein